MENKKNIKKTKSAGGVVVNNDGRVVVVNQCGISWSLPKGHVDGDESYLDTARREIYEETGIKDLEFISDLEIYERDSFIRGNPNAIELKTICMFLFKTNEIALVPIDKDNPEARWVHKDDVADLLTHPKDKEFFLSIKGKI